MAKRRKKSNKTKFLSGDIAIVMLIIVSILLAILIYAETGTIGKTLSPMLGRNYGLFKIYASSGYVWTSDIYCV